MRPSMEISRITVPSTLRDIPSRPRQLFAVGKLPKEQPVAIVGSRRASPYGLRTTKVLASRLATAGVPIVSGLAFGIDIAAHRAVLEAQGSSIAILPTGLDERSISPQSHLNEARSLTERGALLSEYPEGTTARQENYHARNRLISGLARATVVIEAELPSGSLITAKHALEQGKDVWAVPGEIDSPSSRGTNDLIRQGAYPLTDIGEFFEAVGIKVPEKPSTAHPLLRYFSEQPSHVDQLVELSELEPRKLESELTRLELLGLIRHLGGRFYILA